MIGIPNTLADLARDVYGVVSDVDLERSGVTPRQRARLIAQGVLVVVFRGVYRLRSAPERLEGRCRAICLAHEQSVITGRAGGTLWDVRRMGRPERIEVRAPHYCQSLDVPWVRLRRCNVMEAVDVVHRDDGIRVVSPPRLAFDLAADLAPLDLESVIEQIIDNRWCTAQLMIDMGRRLYHPRRPGSENFARVINSRPAWLKPADSHLEVVLYDALRSAGVTGLVRQHRIDLPGGWPIHADVAVPCLRWAIPIDHITWHGGRVAGVRDKQNDRQAGIIGWKVDRVTDEDLTLRFASTMDELLAVHALLTAS